MIKAIIKYKIPSKSVELDLFEKSKYDVLNELNSQNNFMNGIISLVSKEELSSYSLQESLSFEHSKSKFEKDINDIKHKYNYDKKFTLELNYEPRCDNGISEGQDQLSSRVIDSVSKIIKNTIAKPYFTEIINDEIE